MNCTRSRLVPFVLCAMGVVALVLSGCRKEQEGSAKPPAHTPASYVHDKQFMGGLTAARAKHSDLIRARNAIADKMQAMIEAKRAELKTTDRAVIKAALEKDPVWQELYTACTNANERVERHQREVFGKVRERLVPQKISK